MITDIYLILDFVFYFGQGTLLALIFESANSRFCNKNVSCIIMILQYTIVQTFIHNSKTIKNMIIGKDAILFDSRFSIIFVGINLLATYVAVRLLIKESRRKVCYYVLSFWTVLELVKTALYVIFIELMNALIQFYTYLCIEKQIIELSEFQSMVQVTEIIWNAVYCMTELIIAWYVIRQLKKHLNIKDVYHKWQQIFLLFPSVIGLVICIMVRSMMFSIKGTDMLLLVDEHPEMNVLIPTASILCLIMIVIAAKMLRNLINESNRKIEVSIYQNKIEEMENHIKDIERLYEGIRGMKHDMKNYIADMDALMKQNEAETVVQMELRKYLDSLQCSVDQLDMKYHTGNPVTDVVIQRYVQSAKRDGIDFEVDFIFPADMNIDAFDISIILSNGLENAIEACNKLKNGSRRIKIISYHRENMFFIIIRNSFDGMVLKKDGVFQTTKKDSQNHGFGFQNIVACAEKYYGRAETSVKDEYFELAIMLQKRE